MVKIRLQRGGAKRHPFYRIVAIDERRQRDGRALAFLGTYDPNLNPARIQVDVDEIDGWVAKGAQVSDTVRSLVRRARREAPPAESAGPTAESAS